MPRTSKKSKVKSQKLELTPQRNSVSETTPSARPSFATDAPGSLFSLINKKTALIALVVIALLLFAFYKKSWFIAATVNGSLITNPELLSRMNQQYRQQVLNQMINEKIILAEVKKNNVNVSDSEVDNRISQLEEQVGGAQTLDSLLLQQGQTRSDLKTQVKIQLAVEKLYENEATVSAQEVNDFIAKNKEQLQATDSAGQKKETEDLLKQQKLSKIVTERFTELRQQAKITIF